ncbi:MAG: type II secretion system F family protein [Rhodocyclaceae bacterium]|nr:type II secretion system F family protein [Rhodocyclaceae bacterium]
MPWLFYTAATRDGALERRNGRFADAAMLDRELARHGEMLVDYLALPDALHQVRQWALGRLRPLETAEFCNMLSMYVSGGVDLQSALADLESNATSIAYRQILGQVRTGLLNGYPFSQALRETHQFPEEVLALVKIGEESGTLDRVLADAGAHIERIEEIKSAVKRALVYPAFTLVVMIGGALFWLSFVMPKLALVFTSIDIEMPGHVAAMIAASDWVREFWWLLGIILVALPMGFFAARANEGFRYQTDRMAWHMPVMGRIVYGSQMAFWFQYLGLMYGAGVVITQAMEIINKSVKNRFFRDKIANFNARLQDGESLQASIKETRIFEPLAIRMVAIGEETGNLEAQMKKLAGIYFARVNALVEVLAKTLEPAMAIVMAAMLAFFVLGVLAPIYESIGKIGG